MWHNHLQSQEANPGTWSANAVGMPKTDRAFRALAMEQPQAIASLVELCAPGILPAGTTLQPEDIAAPSLIAPPSLQADWAARAGDEQLLHVEGQGYRDDDFVGRLFRYHLGFVLRYPDRTVHSVALWLRRPPERQRVDRIARRGVSVRVTSLVLSELSAELLLSRPETTCFAAAADAGGWSQAELCARVVEALGQGSTERERVLAIVLALATERYDAMIEAMKQAEMELPIIEDLVLFGEDRGRERGHAEGMAKGKAEGMAKGKAEGMAKGKAEGMAAAVLSFLQARGVPVSPADEQRITECRDVAQLDEWTRRAAHVESVAELFG